MVHGVFLRELARKLFGEDFSRRIWRRMEIVGDILVLRKPFNVELEKLRLLATYVLNYLSYVKSVWCSISEIKGKHRVRDYVFLCGEYRSETIYVEHGARFLVDITRVYISPALNYEHRRIAEKVYDNETIINMFAGIGLFSIVSALKKKITVYSIDVNPYAYYYMVKSIGLNKLKGEVIPILGDAKDVIEKELSKIADRVLMPLPELVYDYLKYALYALKPKGFLHVYLFAKGRNREEAKINAIGDYTQFLKKYVKKAHVKEVRVIRSVGTKKYQVVIDYYVEK